MAPSSRRSPAARRRARAAVLARGRAARTAALVAAAALAACALAAWAFMALLPGQGGGQWGGAAELVGEPGITAARGRSRARPYRRGSAHELRGTAGGGTGAAGTGKSNAGGADVEAVPFVLPQNAAMLPARVASWDFGVGCDFSGFFSEFLGFATAVDADAERFASARALAMDGDANGTGVPPVRLAARTPSSPMRLVLTGRCSLCVCVCAYARARARAHGRVDAHSRRVQAVMGTMAVIQMPSGLSPCA